MASRHCAYSQCNAIETAQHSLQTCPACKRVAYCNKDCQKPHWKIHKPVCRAAVYHDRDADEDSASSLDRNKEESITRAETSKDANDKPTLNDMTNSAVTNPDATAPTDSLGTFIEYFTIPTPSRPSGHKTAMNLTRPMITFLASLSEEDSQTAERQLVDGHKLGLEPQNVFPQIVLSKKKLLRIFEERGSDSHAYNNDLQTLAGRHRAAVTQVVHTTMREGGRVEHLKQGRLLFLDVNSNFVIVPVDWAHVFELEQEEKDGEVEVVFFDSDTIANMRYLRADEKEAYKEMSAWDVFEQRYPDKTMAEVAADKKKCRADAQAASEGDMAEQQSVEDAVASMNSRQQ